MKLLLLTLLLLTLPVSAEAGFGFSQLSTRLKIITLNTDPKVANEMANVVYKTFEGDKLKIMQKATEQTDNGYTWGVTQVPRLRRELLKAVIGPASSSVATLTDIDDKLAEIEDLAGKKESYKQQLSDLVLMIDEVFYQARLASQKAMNPERVKEIEAQAEAVLGCSVFTGSMVIYE